MVTVDSGRTKARLSLLTWFAFHALILAAGAALIVAVKPDSAAK